MSKLNLSSVPVSNELFGDMTPEAKEYNRVMAEISYKIASIRRSRGMNQKEFAKALGVSQGMVSRWESCDYNFTMEKLVSIFYALGLQVDFRIFSSTSTSYRRPSVSLSNTGFLTLVTGRSETSKIVGEAC